MITADEYRQAELHVRAAKAVLETALAIIDTARRRPSDNATLGLREDMHDLLGRTIDLAETLERRARAQLVAPS